MEIKGSTRFFGSIVIGLFTACPFLEVVDFGLVFCMIAGASCLLWLFFIEMIHYANELDSAKRWNREQQIEIRQLREENRRLKAELDNKNK